MKVTSSGIRKLTEAMMLVILRSYRPGFVGRKGWVAGEVARRIVLQVAVICERQMVYTDI